MCGIAGILYADPMRPVDGDLLARMNRALVHRGPDGEGVWTGEGVGLTHRRLAIIDLESGHQPMSSADGAVHIVSKPSWTTAARTSAPRGSSR